MAMGRWCGRVAQAGDGAGSVPTCVPVGAGPRTALGDPVPSVDVSAHAGVATEVLLTGLTPGQHVVEVCIGVTLGRRRGMRHATAVSAAMWPQFNSTHCVSHTVLVSAVGPPPPRLAVDLDRRQLDPAFPNAHNSIVAGTAGNMEAFTVRAPGPPARPPLQLQFQSPVAASWVEGHQGPTFRFRVVDTPDDGRRVTGQAPHTTAEAFYRICLFSYASSTAFSTPIGLSVPAGWYAPARLHNDVLSSGRALLAGDRLLCVEPHFTSVMSSVDPVAGVLGVAAVVVDAADFVTSLVASTVVHVGLGGGSGAGEVAEMQHLADRRQWLSHLDVCAPGTDGGPEGLREDCVPPLPPPAGHLPGDRRTVPVTISRGGEREEVVVEGGVEGEVEEEEEEGAPLVQGLTGGGHVAPLPRRGRFAVVIINVPDNITLNFEVFEDVAGTVHAALLELGQDSIRVQCADLVQRCANSEALRGRKAIVIGSNVLSLYTTPSLQPAMFFHDLLPLDAILYNFEFVTPVVRRVVNGMEDDMSIPNNWVTPLFLDIHRRMAVWEYSWGNMEQWDAYGVQATYVPLGYADSMDKPPGPPEGAKDIDVLFFGQGNPYRFAAVQHLEDAGIAVHWPYHAVRGAALDAMVRRAKVVLVLRAFSNAREYKWTRLCVGFANEAFMVSEAMGTPEDVAPYGEGYVQVDVGTVANGTAPSPDGLQRLAATIQVYLNNPGARHAVARAGRELFRARRAAALMAPAVDGLLDGMATTGQ